ncbi:pyridoxal phosphate-dependent transferase [Phycomyces nitens]|nr:pyridoxal phosphate-dependent transferase [Phycomyces nitens]
MKEAFGNDMMQTKSFINPAAKNTPLIDFLNGQPSADLLPSSLFGNASKKLFGMTGNEDAVLNYAPSLGDPDFLKNLAEFLSKEYQTPVYKEHLCATPGASLALEHILALLARPQTTTKFAIFQDPTYHLVYDIYRNVGFKENQFIGIPETVDGGLDIKLLEKFLARSLPMADQRAKDTNDYAAVLYCVPTHANPSTSTLPPQHRKELVDLAHRYNMLILCDDVYDILTYEGTAPKRVVSYDLELPGKGVVVSNCSFSKILAPGARAGWIEAKESLIQTVGVCGSFHSGGSPSNLVCQIINLMLVTTDPDLCLHRHIQSLRDILSNRLYSGLWEPIQKHLIPLGCSAVRPKGGYFVWLKLPLGISYGKLVKAIVDNKIRLSLGVGTLFGIPGENGNLLWESDNDRYIRLCFAHYSTNDLRVGILRLERAIEIASKQGPKRIPGIQGPCL